MTATLIAPTARKMRIRTLVGPGTRRCCREFDDEVEHNERASAASQVWLSSLAVSVKGCIGCRIGIPKNGRTSEKRGARARHVMKATIMRHAVHRSQVGPPPSPLAG